MVWDSNEEEKNVEESVLWLSASDEVREKFLEELADDWILVGDVCTFFISTLYKFIIVLCKFL